jgi:hypothetical protein
MKILANSLPKSGTHLLMRLLDLAGFQTTKRGLAGSVARISTWNPIRRRRIARRLAEESEHGYCVDLDVPTNRVKAAWLHGYLNQLPDGSYMGGHVPYEEILRIFLHIHQYRVLFIYRDPRDVLISLANYHARDYMPFHKEFNRLGKRERWEIALSGISRGSRVLSPFSNRLERAGGWMSDPSVCAIRFEDLVGSHGGGDAEAQRKTIENILSFLEIEISASRLDIIQNGVFSRDSKTFHKGMIGQWKDEMETADLEWIEKQLGEQILRYGYQLAT